MSGKTKDNTEREELSSRLGFLLISAGCAIGLGNIWRFPYITGKYGGAAFVLIYLAFLILLGFPILLMEYSIGRAGKLNIAGAMRKLEPEGSKWHVFGYMGIIRNVLLVMFYTTVAGWGLAYVYYSIDGSFSGLEPQEVGSFFEAFLSHTQEIVFWMGLVVLTGFWVCSKGLQKGAEKVSKTLMSGMVLILLILVIKSVTLPGANAGIIFYLKPDMSLIDSEAIYAAMGQAFFTLSAGAGGMAIFGSYIGKERSLPGETINVVVLDTSIALLAGLVIFPAAFAFGIDAGAGPELIFVTLPNILNQMTGGRLWGILFFTFLAFAAMSTVIAIFENIMAFTMDEWGWKRKKAAFVNTIGILALSLPCALSFGPLSWIQPFGPGTGILDLEDFIFSNNILPVGALAIVMFCTLKTGWGWDRFIKEANIE
ncbi:sodium-dependent transporter [Methanolobus bombayensis]|uniref:sodium-dependent transporter n=1 Tax=Methanolobus bombayensis TaxID=38023 RepID=UPI001FD82D15|nr:sodium-dependent transporter [Methanolobus bombayensis]MBP1910434.1 NSS family neurotransmitter:Na+ symporter [Methanolobus bombayensis]